MTIGDMILPLPSLGKWAWPRNVLSLSKDRTHSTKAADPHSTSTHPATTETKKALFTGRLPPAAPRYSANRAPFLVPSFTSAFEARTREV